MGRTVRLLVGLLLLAVAVQSLAGATLDPGLALRIAGWTAILVALYLVLHLAVRRWTPDLHPWAGAALALLPAVALWVTGGARALSVILFIGLSLVVAAVRSDGGCEVMSLPALLSGRRTHFVCLLFSPIDRVEARLRKRA